MRLPLEPFDPALPIERSLTPPSSWYTSPHVLELEREAVFFPSFQPVGRADELREPGDYISGHLVGQPWLALRDGETLRAFFNVCRHHASHIVEGAGRVEQLVCPYHGWCYDLDGRLRKAPRIGGHDGFDRTSYGLIPIELATWGPFVWLRFAKDQGGTLEEWMAPLAGRIDLAGLRFARRVSYEIACNWKVYVDNYLDGGYHVAHLHRGLAGQLDLTSYRTEIVGRVSLQTCGAAGEGSGDGVDFSDRIGGGAVYAFIYPNFMINRYGPMMDTNWVVPLGHDRTLTVFDYFFDATCDDAFIERSLVASDRVQQEDVGICEAVQRGLASTAFDRGPYAPRVEQGAHHFHGLLARDLQGAG